MAQHFRLSAVARTISLGQDLRMVDAEVETTFAPAIWWRLLHKSAGVRRVCLENELVAGGQQTIERYAGRQQAEGGIGQGWGSGQVGTPLYVVMDSHSQSVCIENADGPLSHVA